MADSRIGEGDLYKSRFISIFDKRGVRDSCANDSTASYALAGDGAVRVARAGALTAGPRARACLGGAFFQHLITPISALCAITAFERF